MPDKGLIPPLCRLYANISETTGKRYLWVL
jgi:hypothetical protein